MDAPDGMQVDHINMNRLDNRKANLRLCNNSQNHANSVVRTKSGFKGVYRDKTRRKWKVVITVRNHAYTIGRYDSKEDAAIMYNTAAQIFFGEFARLNTI